MKPTSKIQREIVSLSRKMKPISERQKRYAYRHCIEPFAKRTAKSIYTCCDCAHIWKDSLSHVPAHVTCPHCSRKLKVSTDRKRTYSFKVYFTIITAIKGYQVLRHFVVLASFKVGRAGQYAIKEVVQRWLTPKGATHTFALKRNMCTFYYDSWNFNTELELRSCPENFYYDIDAMYVYPKIRLSDTIVRNGYCGDNFDLSHYTVFKAILSDNRKETLLKCGQISLFQYFAGKSSISDDIWKAIKTGIRHRYHFPDVGLWLDYIRLLQHFKKDISNPHYACPSNLNREHDRWSRKKQEEAMREQLKEKKRKAVLQEKHYQEAKAKFFGLIFEEGDILIRVLESVQEFVEEGEALHHCVFTNEYFNDDNSLVFSALVGGVRTETIEVSLETMKVVQCRGRYNKNSKFHDEILKVMNKNIPLIAKRMCG